LPEGAEGTVEAEQPAEESALDGLLKHLTSREAQIARLVHAEQLTFHEAAEALSISVSSVKTHYYRGLEKLRSVLTPQDEALDRRQHKADRAQARKA
jgi:RNA polymerase sigma factor (sigma-70 family)